MADYGPAVEDQLLNSGLETYNPVQRFQIYSKLLQNLNANVPYVPLFLTDYEYAMSKGFTASGLDWWTFVDSDPLLQIKAAA
jgi:ABC-type transport system substrate-binding protein